jgi:hypothetical protein
MPGQGGLPPARPLLALFILPFPPTRLLMKSTSLLLSTVVLLLLGLAAPFQVIANDNSQPLSLFGTTISVRGETFVWQSATDNGTYREDSYSYSAGLGSVAVTTKINYPALATVTGTSGQGTVDGHLSNGTYADNHSASGTSADASWESWTYTVNLATNKLQWERASGSNDGNGNTSASWESSEGDWSTRYDSSDGLGSISWSESWGIGSTTLGTRASGTSNASSSGSSVTLFGQTFGETGSGSSWETESIAGVTTVNYSTESKSYLGVDSWLQVSNTYDQVSGTAATVISGWTPEIGAFSASTNTQGISDWSAVVWDARTSPSLLREQENQGLDRLWVNGWLVSWQSGTLTSSGVVTDVYASASGQLELRISGDAREVVLGNLTAEVRIQGVYVGDVDSAGHFNFNVSGWTVSTSGGGQGSNTPFFLANTAVLWVDGVEFAFEERLSDGNGGHVDAYSSPSGAGTLRLAGTTVGSAHVAGNLHTRFFHGSLANSSFTIAEVAVSVSTLPPPAALPEALWVRGGFYVPDAAPGTTGVYVCDPPGEAGPFTLSVTAVAGGFTITGTDDVSAISGTLLLGGGLGFLHAGADSSAPLSVPVIQATAAGLPQATGETLDDPPGLPLAVEVQGAVLVFTGTLAEPSRAVYLPVNVGSARRWLELRLDTHAVKLTDHSTQQPVVTNGSYDPATFLFSTVHGSGSLPEYVHAAQHDGNHAHLRLPLPEGMNLPPSFIVRGQPWWFAGWNDANDEAIYRGFYQGQVLELGAADAEGQRLVTLTDPVHNNGSTVTTQGTLSNVRGSVRLRDGTLVLSGNTSGQQQVISMDDVTQLHTISADLDILGNVLSFGILNNDASLAAVAWRFEQRAGIATLHNILSRPEASWRWWRAGGAQSYDLKPVMHLDSTNRLQLHSSGSGTSTAPGVVLDPAVNGTSTLRGVLRVRPGGDIGMGGFTAGGEP